MNGIDKLHINHTKHGIFSFIMTGYLSPHMDTNKLHLCML